MRIFSSLAVVCFYLLLNVCAMKVGAMMLSVLMQPRAPVDDDVRVLC